MRVLFKISKVYTNAMDCSKSDQLALRVRKLK